MFDFAFWRGRRSKGGSAASLVKPKKMPFLIILATLFFPCKTHADGRGAGPEARLELQAEAAAGGRKKETVKSMLSLDLGWFLHGLANNGIALGVNYERLLMGHFSLRGMAGAMFLGIPDEDAYCLGITTSVFANWYPMSKMLDKFYAGLGFAADFLNYFGQASLPCLPMDTLVSVMPLVGWKQNIANVILLDVFGGYSFILFSTQRFSESEEYIRSGIQLGLRFKVLWRPGKGS